jgi:hypothetical protein
MPSIEVLKIKTGRKRELSYICLFAFSAYTPTLNMEALIPFETSVIVLTTDSIRRKTVHLEFYT